MNWIRQWWRQPDHYQFLTDYLGARRIRRFIRYMMAFIISAFGIIPALAVLSPSEIQSTAGRVVALAVTASCAVMAVMWLRRWPSRRGSEVFAMTGIIGVAALSLVKANPLDGVLGCAAFAGLAGYVAFFHSSRMLTLTLAIAGLTAIVRAVQIAAAGDPFAAVGSFLVISVAVLAVPFCGQVLVTLLSVEASRSHTDSLTQLRNRRGFYRGATEKFVTARDSVTFFTVTMVDLDGFKRINDAHGHVVGDQTLIGIGKTIEESYGHDAIVARVGGEEFLIAETTEIDDAEAAAERLCSAIAATSWRVTASLGVTCMRVVRADETTVRQVIEHLVKTADAAMYEAKRAGGNQVRYQGVADEPVR